MATKLTIHKNRNTNQTHWFESSHYSQDLIKDINDPTGATTKKILTAIPSPFSRMHLFETAFEMINTTKDHDGNSLYHKMISDCFDVLELLFNWDCVKAAHPNLKIQIWDRVNSLVNMKNSNSDGQKTLSSTLELYLEQDRVSARFESMCNFYLLTLDYEVFAGSSPMTLYFTNPDLRNFPIKKNVNEKYFEKSIPLHRRDNVFQLYVHRLFKSSEDIRKYAHRVYEYVLDSKEKVGENDSSFQTKLNAIHNTQFNITEYESDYTYITDDHKNDIKILNTRICKSNKPIDLPDNLKIKPSKVLPDYLSGIFPIVPKQFHDSKGNHNINITWKDKTDVPLLDRLLVDCHVKYPYFVASDFLENTLIRVNYPINKDYFVTGKYDGFDPLTTDGFLLPIKKEYFDYFNLFEIQDFLTFQKISNGVKVKLDIPVQGNSNVTFEKSYYENVNNDNDGKLILSKFNFAFFPFYKVLDQQKYNDFYKIMFVSTDNYLGLDVSFYVNNRLITSNPNNSYHHKKISRTSQNNGKDSSVFFEIRNTHYDMLLVESSINDVKGLIIPKLKTINLGVKEFTVSVDYGTTNTHVAYTDDSTYTSLPKSFFYDENDQQVVSFNLPNLDPDITSFINKYENLTSALYEFIIKQRHEFIPSIIGKEETNVLPKYKFPIRSAISEQKNLILVGAMNTQVLGNMNISFVYEKEKINDYEDVYTDLKWSIKKDIGNKIRIAAFIEEILLLIKNKVIMNDGNPEKTKLIWFWPLSMDSFSKDLLHDFWTEKFREIFQSRLIPRAITESQAPYYFLLRNLEVYGKSPVLCLDIGGGSTDLVFYDNRKPKFGTSFNFAGNAIWGGGLNRMLVTREGIANKYKEIVDRKCNALDKGKRQVIYEMLSSFNQKKDVRPEDLMNLYFSLNNELRITDDIESDMVVKFLVLLHFSAIIYHIFQLMNNSKIPPPKFISLSGRGSRYLTYLGDSNKIKITKIINQIAKELFDIKEEIDIKLISHADNEKEVTCMGGIFSFTSTDDSPSHKIFLGEKNFKGFNDELRLTYKSFESIKKDVVDNLHNFYDLFFSLNKILPFMDFGIEFNFSEINEFLKKNTEEYLEMGREYRLHLSNEDEMINETLFFYPLIQAIYELSIELYKK